MELVQRYDRSTRLPIMAIAIRQSKEEIRLPKPRLDSSKSIESALSTRRSVRNYTNQALTLAEVSQLLWAAQGITHGEGYRTAPSAGALYPLEIYLVAGHVENLAPGLYQYKIRQHVLQHLIAGDQRRDLYSAALAQDFILNSAISIVITAVYQRTTFKYGQRGDRYIHMEVGHVSQNIHLQAAALNLGTVVVGAFQDERIKAVLNLPADEQPLCIMPVGKHQSD